MQDLREGGIYNTLASPLVGGDDFRAVCCALLAKSLGAASSNKGAHVKRGPMPVGETASSESLAMAEGAAVQPAADEIVVDTTPTEDSANPQKQSRRLKKGMTDLFDADAMGKSGRTLNQEGKHGSKEKPPRLVPARDALDC